MRSKIATKKIAGFLTAGALTVATAGGAYAYWTASGAGASSAATSSGAPDLTAAQTQAPANLAPGVVAGTVAGTVMNKGTSSAYVTQVTLSISSVIPPAGVTGTCNASDYTVGSATMSIRQDIAPGATVSSGGAPIGFNAKTTNQDACKGATVTLAYAAS